MDIKRILNVTCILFCRYFINTKLNHYLLLDRMSNIVGVNRC